MKETIEKVLPENYLLYAGYVAQHRAIADARDFLKDGARKIIFAQWKSGITHDKGFQKGTKNVAATMSYSVHGPAPIYGNMVRMAQPFSLRYPLVDYEGGVGTLVNGDDYSADRYLELRGSAIAAEMTRNLKKDAVAEWKDNYDETEKYPAVLPAYFPNLCNGVSGIGVGLATSIPTFNVKDVIAALSILLNNGDATFDELYCPIDFPTGAIVVNESEVKDSLRAGKGKAAKIYAKIDYDSDKNELVVRELPYQVFTSTVCQQLQKAIDEGKLLGVDSFFDGTDFNGVNIRIRLTKKGNPKKITSLLYKHTSLGHHYGINMVLLANGLRPKVFTWKEILSTYLAHLQTTVRRSYEFDLRKAKERLHIVEGLLKAVDIIDEVVRTIKSSPSPGAARMALTDTFLFSLVQADAILNMRLARLTNLEKQELTKEKEKLAAEITRINHILGDGFTQEIERELAAISKKYGDARRTTNIDLELGENDEPAEKRILMVYFSEFGSVLAQEIDQYTLQLRGGKGTKVKMRPGDFIKESVYADNGSWVVVFTSLGRAHTFYLNDLEVGSEYHIQALLDLQPNEEVMAILPYDKAKNYNSVIIGTKNGYLKKSSLDTFVSKSKKPIVAIKLREGDAIASVSFVSSGDNLLVVSKKGSCIRIREQDVPETGRATMGVIGIRLDSGNELLNVLSFGELAQEVCSISTVGLIKRTPLTEFSLTGRATKGVKIHSLREDEEVAATAVITQEKEIMAVSQTNAIRISLAQVPQSSRNTMGVHIMKNPGKITKISLLKD